MSDIWMTCNVVNETSYVIAFLAESYFDSGHYDKAPTNTPPKTTMTFTITKGSGGFAGATGGAKFYLKADGGDIPFAVGFCAPVLGGYKAGVTLGSSNPGSPTPEDGYNSATNEGNAVTVATADSKVFTITAVPGATSQFTISGPA